MASILSKIVGHESIRDRLFKALQADLFPAVQLFYGPSGIGKKTVALGLAQAVLCDRGENCGVCTSCQKVEDLSHESLRVIIPEGIQIKIGQAHSILEFLRLKSWGRRRIVILDEVTALNSQAANALLKILEEPPADAIFFLLTTNIHNVLPTLRSRAQSVRFLPLNTAELKQIVAAEPWMYRASAGQHDQVRQFLEEESLQLRRTAFLALHDKLAGRLDSVRNTLEPIVGSVDKGLFVIRLWRQILRDLVLPNSHERIHQDLELDSLPAVSRTAVYKLFHHMLRMECDILSHVDRALVFENFIFYSLDGQ